MANFGVFLVALAGPIARRVLLSLGLGGVRYAGLALIAEQVKTAVVDNYGALSGNVLDLLNLLGAVRRLESFSVRSSREPLSLLSPVSGLCLLNAESFLYLFNSPVQLRGGLFAILSVRFPVFVIRPFQLVECNKHAFSSI